MRKFIQRALNKLAKLDEAQIRSLLYQMASENDRLEAVLYSMMDGVLVSDTAHKLILYNKAAEPLLKVTGGDHRERKIWTVIHDAEIAAFVEESLKNQEKVYDKEYTIDYGGISRILSFSIMPLVRERSIQGNLIHIEEVTEKKSKEARLRRAENLASLTTLAAGVAHEIKNPLGSISIHLQLIQKELSAGNGIRKDSMQQNLDIIGEEVSRLNSIVVDFLFAVRPMNSVLEEKCLNTVVRETVDFVRMEMAESGIEIRMILCEEDCKIELDEKLIKQALLNLIKNAEAAMPEGGTLTIRTRKRQGVVELTVEDTGIGIPADIIPKIFEPYFTTKEFGSGLGLTVIFKIMKEHKGEINVKSKEDRGTTFTLIFPVSQKEQQLLDWQGDRNEF